jgi:hypothetical protein
MATFVGEGSSCTWSPSFYGPAAITLFSIGRYSEAWAKVKLAEATPNKDDLDP